jgi:hypothetical protein
LIVTPRSWWVALWPYPSALPQGHSPQSFQLTIVLRKKRTHSKEEGQSKVILEMWETSCTSHRPSSKI